MTSSTSDRRPSETRSSRRSRRLRIATFNINGVVGRLSALAAWLEETAPDVVCLQELKCHRATFPHAALERLGYHASWVAEGRWNGVAILSRGRPPVTVRDRLPGDPDDREARYLEAAVEGILVASIYLPNGNPRPGPKFDRKLAWLARLRTHAATLLAENVPVVLAGDFNVVPTDRDIYRTSSWSDDALLAPQSRRGFADLLDQGWTDSIRARHPEAPCYTWWDYKRDRWPRDAGLRLDHLLLSPQLSSRLRDAGVDRETRGRVGASDHAPAWISLSA